MLIEKIDTGNSLLEVGVNTNINERVKYTANTQTTLFNAGPFTVNIITGAGNGTLVKTMTIKAFSNTIKGMIYLYLDNGGSPIFLDTIPIDNGIQYATQETFEITYELDYYLASGISIQAYMNTIQNFTITMQGLDMFY